MEEVWPISLTNGSFEKTCGLIFADLFFLPTAGEGVGVGSPGADEPDAPTDVIEEGVVFIVCGVVAG